MGWRRVTLGLTALLCANPASAADKPELAPPDAWIKPLTAPPVAGSSDAAALHVLLRDIQVSFHGASTRTFSSNAFQITKPEALTALGTFSLAWKPETDRVIVHWLRIRRGATIIDLLHQQQFTVLRREQNLELAAIDGVLTATMPLTGLQVGDIVETAWTVERIEPLLHGHHDLALDAGTAGNIARIGLIAQWDRDDPVALRSHNLPAVAAITPTSISLSAGPVDPLILPQGAPLRFQLGRLIELSDFADWTSVSATFAPLYATARQLQTGSPLHAEIDRIKAASSDPAMRAGLALKLVEDNVRYLYLGLNDGNLRPAAADETWQRRFGDCKAKTALLLAMLDGLGISAEPAIVSTRLGGGLDMRLPNASQFDHVIVRAIIAAKVYWLDGTRLGDRHIAELDVPDYHWALPLVAHGGHLEPLVVAPKTMPNTVYDLHLDASKGIMAPAPAHAEATFAGDIGVAMHATIAAASTGARDQQLRSFWSRQYDFITPQRVSEVWDDATRTELLVMDGSARMAWDDAGGGNRRYQLDGVGLGWHADFRRQFGPDSDAPFTVGYPDFTEYRETVLLPDAHNGFSLNGDNVDRELAGYAMYRNVGLIGNRVTMVARQRPLVAELLYPAAQAANDDLRALADGGFEILLKGTSYDITADDARAMLAAPINKGDLGYRTHLTAFTALNDIKAGLAEAQRYLAAFPKSAEAQAARAVFEAAAGLDDQAKADAATALALSPDVNEAKMVTAYYKDASGENAAQFTRPAFFVWAKWGVANKCYHDRDYACAQRNAEAALALQPNVSMIYVVLANVAKAQGRVTDAAAVADRMVAIAPRDADMLSVAGVIYCETGQRTKGLAAFGASLAIRPSITAYLNRIRYLLHSDLAARKRDIDGALELAPQNVDAMEALADWQGQAGDHAGQIATLQSVAAHIPTDAEPNMPLTIELGGAYARAGEGEKARESFAEVRGYALATKNGHYFNELCYTAAKADFDLDAALADCKRAVAFLPKRAFVLDSLGFVNLRKGLFADAITAYDEVLQIDPQEDYSLYGRGIARLRQGDKGQGQADIAAAIRLDPSISDDFRAMGISP